MDELGKIYVSVMEVAVLLHDGVANKWVIPEFYYAHFHFAINDSWYDRW